jgi:hypothetical protein
VLIHVISCQCIVNGPHHKLPTATCSYSLFSPPSSLFQTYTYEHRAKDYYMANTEERTGTSANGISDSFSRQSQIHALVDATKPSQAGHTSTVSHRASLSITGSPSRPNLPLRPNKNGPSRQRARPLDSVEVPLDIPRPHKTLVASFVTPSRRPNAEARVKEDNPSFGTFSDEYDLCEYP